MVKSSGRCADEVSRSEGAYGHVVWTDPSQPEDVDKLVGAIGCAAEVIVAAPAEKKKGGDGGGDMGSGIRDQTGGAEDEDLPIVVLARGSFRFVVREIVQTFPYPVGIVDELPDSEPSEAGSRDAAADDEDEDEDDEDDYDWCSDLTTPELVQRTIVFMKTLIDQKLSANQKAPSPLEQAIMKDAGVSFASMAAKRTQAEEMMAVLDVFQSSLADIAPMPIDRYYAIGMLAAEMADVDNEVRRNILTLTDGVERLRLVLKELDRKISIASAKKLTEEITGRSGGGGQELTVCSLCIYSLLLFPAILYFCIFTPYGSNPLFAHLLN